MVFTLDTDRLATTFEAWEQLEPSAAVAMCSVVGQTYDDMPGNQRSMAVLQYLFDTDEISEIALAYLRTDSSRVCLIGSPRSPGEFIVAESIPSKSAGGAPITVRLFGGEDAGPAFEEALKEAGGSVGVCQRELPEQKGPFAEALVAAVSAESLGPVVERSNQIGALLAVKDTKSIEYIQKAAALASATLKRYVLPQIEEQLEHDKRIPMNQLSEAIWEMLQHPNRLPGLEALPAQHYDGAFSPVVVQSGGHYNLRIIQESMRPEPLVGDCIVIAYGSVHMGHTAYLARTILIESQIPKDLPDRYTFVLSVASSITKLLRPGTALCDVYSNALNAATQQNAALASQLSKEFGFMTGLLVLESRGIINEKSMAVVEVGMTFVVRVSLQGPALAQKEGEAAEADPKRYSLLLGDTVVVREASTDLLTKGKRELNDIVYREEQVVAEAESSPEKPQRDLRAITRAGKGAIPQISGEEARRARQMEIFAEKAASWTASGGDTAPDEAEDLKVTEIGRLVRGDTVSHRAADTDLPRLVPTQLEVERAKETLWIPVNKIPTPFHLCTIQKVDLKSLSQMKHLLTIYFHSLQESNVAFRTNRTKGFIKQITVVGESKERFEHVANQVHDMLQTIKNRDAQRKQNQGVVKQAGLQVNKKGTAPRLKRVKCRPPPMPAKFGVVGDLEAHDNGFRFVWVGGEPVVILYENVKHLILQPSQNDLCVVFHVTLKQPIILGKKKSDEIQFAAEVVETSEQVTVTRRTYEEEIALDDRDMQRVKQTNTEFILFSQKVETAADTQVQMPFQQFDFTGCASRAVTKFRGNDKCIWSLTEIPFFTLSLADVEVVSLERVVPGGGNFDMAFIHKGYKKTSAITIIPLGKIDAIKDWLNTARLIYFESSANISWPPVLKEIRDSKGWEPWGPGGWRTYWDDDSNDSDEADEEDEESDEDWADSDDSSEDEEDSDEDDSDWAEESESESEAASSSAESGESWEELERKAEEHDRRRQREEGDDDSDAPKRKPPRRHPPPPPTGGGGAGMGHSTAQRRPPQPLPPRGGGGHVSRIPPPMGPPRRVMGGRY